ncbi:MAG: hypothetical protein ACLRMZ_02950 [Blautia marasmi]
MCAQPNKGCYMCRFIYWLKQNVGKEEITEYSAAEKVMNCVPKT